MSKAVGFIRYFISINYNSYDLLTELCLRHLESSHFATSTAVLFFPPPKIQSLESSVSQTVEWLNPDILGS